MSELEEKVSDVLLTFIDFLYAVVFGLIIAEAFDKVVFSEKTYIEKGSALLLVLGVFYFLMWDWLHGRLLTLKNPYKSYRRFFIELSVAFFGFGAAYAVLHAKVSFLIYIVLILILGARWAGDTLKEHPGSRDKRELRVIQLHQRWQAILGSIIALWWYMFVSQETTFLEAIAFVLFGWFFILGYELLVPRPLGISTGPGVPFMRRETVDRVRSILLKCFRYLTQR